MSISSSLTSRRPISRVSGPGHFKQCLPHPIAPRSLSDIDRSIAANDPQPSASFSARKNPQRIPANTPPVFPGLRPCIWPHLLRLVTKAMPDRLLASMTHERFCCNRGSAALAREASFLTRRSYLVSRRSQALIFLLARYASRFTNDGLLEIRFTRNGPPPSPSPILWGRDGWGTTNRHE